MSPDWKKLFCGHKNASNTLVEGTLTHLDEAGKYRVIVEFSSTELYHEQF